MKQLNELFAYVVVDAAGREGVLRRRAGPFGPQPMIADSLANLQQFHDMAQDAAAQMRLPLRIVRFVRLDREERPQ